MSIYNAEKILLDNGYKAEGQIQQDDKIHRFGKDKKYWYALYDNWLIAGDWSGQLPDISEPINKEEYSSLTAQQKEGFRKRVVELQKSQAQEKLNLHRETSVKAVKSWGELSDTGVSEYLQKKGLLPVLGIKFGNKYIATAIIDNNNQICSLQFIYDDGKKHFIKNGKLKGCYSRFGNDKNNNIYICEGIATALSILQAKPNSLVITAYSCHNLKEVAKNIKNKYPNHKIVIAGDDDVCKDINIGKVFAENIAKELDLSLVLPSFKDTSNNPSDFDDLRQLQGIEEVRRQLEGNQTKNNPIIPIQNDNLKPVKKLEVNNLLPNELQEFVKDVSSRLCVPIDFVAIPLIIGFSSLIAGKVAVKPKENDDFCIFANLWGGLIGNPSARKTPSLKEALFFFSKLEKEAKEVYDDKRDYNKKELNKYKISKKALEDEYMKIFKGGKDTSQIEGKLNSLEEPKIISLERYRINEATTQKITEILRDNKNPSLLLERDELAGFLSNLDKKENEADRSYFLEMWNGNATIRSDTIGRGSIIANNTSIAIAGTTQPDLIIRYLEKTLNSLNDGLLQRFQLLIYPDPVKNEYTDSKPNKEAKNGIVEIANFLNNEDHFNHASGSIEKEGKNYPYFSFNKEAQAIYQKWYVENDQKVNQLCKDGKALISQHLSKYHKLLPALCLIFHLVKMKHEEKSINATTISKAILFCNYLESHAHRVYSLLSGEDGYNNTSLEFIEKVKNKIVKEKEKSIFLQEFTKRDIKRKFGSYKDDVLEKILNILVEHNYFIEKYTPPAKQQREKYSYFLNQILIKEFRNEQ